MLEPRDDIADIRLESQLTREWIAQLEGKMKDVLESVVDICHALERHNYNHHDKASSSGKAEPNHYHGNHRVAKMDFPPFVEDELVECT